MTPQPTGTVLRTVDGLNLVLTRSFQAPIEDVWASITESESTARWFGPWEGTAGPGRTVKVKMVFEEEGPWSSVRIDHCEPPRRLGLTQIDDSGNWRMEVELTTAGDTTVLKFIQHNAPAAAAGEIGPGWEYYLDMLVAARDGKPLPNFDDYYPAQKEYFEKQAAGAENA